jgi:glycosyltransferase involved in cell wall biosynthesis
VSVVMSAYNAEATISDAVRSLLEQTYENIEVIVVDDGSTDKTSEKVKDFRDRRVRLLVGQTNLGLTKRLNQAIQMAAGEFVGRLDSDDISVRHRIERQVEFLNYTSNVGIVGSRSIEVSAWHHTSCTTPEVPESHDEIMRGLFYDNPFVHSSLLIRRSVLDDVGLYDERFRYSQDYELVFRILRRHRGHNLREPLVIRRIGNGSVSVDKARQQIVCAIRARLHAVLALGYPTVNLITVPRQVLRLAAIAIMHRRRVHDRGVS